MRLVVIVLFGLIWAQPLAAGPWPREKGAVFVSFTQSVSGAGRAELTGYGEYGLGRSWTLGFDAMVRGAPDETSATLFLRRSFLSGNTRFSAELGVGFSESPGTSETILRSGVAWGRGFTRPVQGWMELDLKLDLRNGGLGLKADSTLGLKPNDNFMTIVSLQGAQYPGATATLHAASSLVWQARPGVHLEIGLRQGVIGTHEASIRAGTWISF